MAIKSSINTSTINRSVGSFKQSLNNAQKSAGKVNSSILQRNRFKKESISKKSALFVQRRVAVRRKESQDAAEASSALGVRRAPARISTGSTRSFFGRMMDISGALLAGWLVGNLPNIINLAEATTRRSIEVARVLRGAIGSFTQILNTLFTGLTNIGSSILKGDLSTIPTKLSDSVREMQNSFFRMYKQLEDAYDVLKKPLDFSDSIEELRQRLLDDGYVVPGAPGPSPDGTPGTPGSGGGRLQPIHKQALDKISEYESAGAGGYNAMNQGTINDSKGQKPYSGTSLKAPGIKKPLTEMTIGEVIRRQSRKLTNDQGFIHAAGRYQFTGLEYKMKLAGLKPTDMFSPENQDYMAIVLLQKEGVGHWLADPRSQLKNDKEGLALIERARKTPLGQPTATVQPGTKYAKNQNITSVVGAKGTPAVVVSSLRGMRTLNGVTRWHGGIDIATEEGTYIALRANCVVLYAGTRGGYGLMVDVWVESQNIKLRMAHCSSILPNCKVGAVISAGVSFARVGNTGESTGPHIHFEADTSKRGTMTNGRDYGGNTTPDPYVPLLLLTSRQSNGFKGVTSANGKPLAKTTPTGTGGGSEIIESLTPERTGQTVVISQPQAQAMAPPPPSAASSTLPMVVGDSLNSIHNSILLNQLAYT